jgi:hypothetical protein
MLGSNQEPMYPSDLKQTLFRYRVEDLSLGRTGYCRLHSLTTRVYHNRGERREAIYLTSGCVACHVCGDLYLCSCFKHHLLGHHRKRLTMPNGTDAPGLCQREGALAGR